MPRLLKYCEAAEVLNLPAKTVADLCNQGQLKRIRKNSRVVRVTMDSVERLIKQIERESNYRVKAAS